MANNKDNPFGFSDKTIEAQKRFIELMDTSFEEQGIEPTPYKPIDVYDILKEKIKEQKE